MTGQEGFPQDRERLLAILNSMMDGVYVISGDFEVEFVNAAVLKQFGSVNSRKCYAYLHGRSDPCPWCNQQQVEAGQSVHWEWICPKTGKIYDSLDAPLLNPDGSISKIKLIRDITGYKRAEQKVGDLAKFPSENPSPVLRIARDGTILYSNLPGKSLLESWHKQVGQTVPSQWLKIIQKALSTGRTMVRQVRLSKRFFSFVVAPVGESGYVNLYGRDITQHKQVEAALRESEERFHRMFERHQAVMLVLEPDSGVILEANAAAEEYYGYSRDVLCTMQIQEINQLPSDAVTAECHAAAQEQRNYFVFQHRLADGQVRWVEVYSSPFQAGGRKLLFSVIHDITERKRLEQQLLAAHEELEQRVRLRTAELAETVNSLEAEIQRRRQVEQVLHDRSRDLDAFFSNTITPLVMLDREFNFVRVNQAYAAACGRSPEEFVGHNHFELFPHKENQRIFQDVVRTRTPYQAFAKPFMFADYPEWGVTYWDWTLVPIMDDTGQVVLLVFALEDVTARKRAELALRDSEEKYRKVVEISPEAICVVEDEVIAFANPAALSLLRVRDAQNLIGCSIWRFVHPDSMEVVRDRLKKLPGSRSVISPREVKVVCLDGSTIEVEASIAELPSVGHKGFQIMFHDITERKQAEQNILAQQKELRSLATQLQLAEERERRRIAQDLHDSIGQILSFAGSELRTLQRKTRDDIADSLGEVTRQLDIAVHQARTLSFDLSPSLLYDLGLEVAIEDLADRFSRERDIKCTFSACASNKPLSDDVKVLLYRSARELLINAAKHAQAEEVRISCTRQGSQIHIRVEDNGQGFDISVLEDTNRQDKGFGLINLRERLHYIGGQLTVESAPGRGTKAVLIAPLNSE